MSRRFASNTKASTPTPKMPRIPNREIDEAETIVRNSEYIRLYREYNLFLENGFSIQKYSDRETQKYYWRLMDYAFIAINNELFINCPHIKWRRKFTNEFARNLPENTKTYQKQALFVTD